VLDPHHGMRCRSRTASTPATRNSHSRPSYSIDLHQKSAYGQLNWNTEIGGMALRGNAGLRVINTTFNVRQNISGPGQPMACRPATWAISTPIVRSPTGCRRSTPRST
jgi:hypothetical protein